MTLHTRRRAAVIVAGAIYTTLGLLLGAAAARAATPQSTRLWNLSAFVLSGIVALIHVGLERLVWAGPPFPAARQVGFGGALGGLGLAIAANLHDLASAAGYRPRMLIALLIWPVLTGGAAFLGAYVAASLHHLMKKG